MRNSSQQTADDNCLISYLYIAVFVYLRFRRDAFLHHEQRFLRIAHIGDSLNSDCENNVLSNKIRKFRMTLHMRLRGILSDYGLTMQAYFDQLDRVAMKA